MNPMYVAVGHDPDLVLTSFWTSEFHAEKKMGAKLVGLPGSSGYNENAV